jgi:hypothetical protein
MAPIRTRLTGNSLLHFVNKADNSAMSSFDSVATVKNGIREFSDWSDHVEYDMLRGLVSLANLATDDFQRDATVSREKHYLNRLHFVLNHTTLDLKFDELAKKLPYPPKPSADYETDVASSSVAVNTLGPDASAETIKLLGEMKLGAEPPKLDGPLTETASEIGKIKEENARLKAELEMMKMKMVGKGSESTTKLGDDEDGAKTKTTATS